MLKRRPASNMQSPTSTTSTEGNHKCSRTFGSAVAGISLEDGNPGWPWTQSSRRILLYFVQVRSGARPARRRSLSAVSGPLCFEYGGCTLHHRPGASDRRCCPAIALAEKAQGRSISGSSRRRCQHERPPHYHWLRSQWKKRVTSRQGSGYPLYHH